MKTKNVALDKLISKIEILDISDNDKKELIKLTNNIKDEKEKKKKVKDPNAPKRPQNGFMLFMEDVRKIKDNKKPGSHFPINRIDDIKNIINNNKDKPVTELSKSCGVFWNDAKDDEKVKYENTYKKSHDKYKKEMEKYKKESIENV